MSCKKLKDNIRPALNLNKKKINFNSVNIDLPSINIFFSIISSFSIMQLCITLGENLPIFFYSDTKISSLSHNKYIQNRINIFKDL